MKKKTAAPKKTLSKPRKPKFPPLAVLVDFPLEGEKVSPGHYAIRLSAHGADEVELSIDGREWLACREAIGHHWYDWEPEPAGRRLIEARARRGAKGRWVKSGPRSFEVVPA